MFHVFIPGFILVYSQRTLLYDITRCCALVRYCTTHWWTSCHYLYCDKWHSLLALLFSFLLVILLVILLATVTIVAVSVYVCLLSVLAWVNPAGATSSTTVVPMLLSRNIIACMMMTMNTASSVALANATAVVSTVGFIVISRILSRSCLSEFWTVCVMAAQAF